MVQVRGGGEAPTGLGRGLEGGDGVRAARPPRAAGTCLRKGLSQCDLLGRLSKSRGCGVGPLSLLFPLFFLQSQDENGWPSVTGKPQGSEAGLPGCRSLLGICGHKQSQDRCLQCPRSGGSDLLQPLEGVSSVCSQSPVPAAATPLMRPTADSTE